MRHDTRTGVRALITRFVGTAAGGRWRQAWWLGLGVVALALLVEGFVLRDPFEPSPRDIDAGVKRAQALGLLESGFAGQALPYRARYLDPQQWYLPFVKPFVMRTRTGMQSIFPTVAAMIDVPAEWLGGLAAVRLLSIIALLAGIAAALRCMDRAGDGVAPVVIVFATPLWFYAYFGSSHPVGLALAMLGLAVAFNQGNAFLAGLLLGIAGTVREEVLVLLPGLALFGTWRWRRPLPLIQLAAGVLVPLSVVAVVDVEVYGRPAAAHLMHALRGTFFPDLPSAGLPAMKSMTWLARFDVVFVYWLDGWSRGHAVLVAVLLAAAALVRWRLGIYWGAVPVVAVILLGAFSDVGTMLATPRRTPGLLRLAPFLIFAALPSPVPADDGSWRRRTVLLMSGLFVLIAFLTTNTDGGRPLGPRLLLPVWVLLAIVAWEQVRAFVATRNRSVAHKALAAAGVFFVAAGVFINAGRLVPLFRHAEQDAQGAAKHLAGVAEEVIVMGSPFVINPVIGAYPRKSIMLASSAADTRDIADRLGRARVARFLYVRRNDREDLLGEFPGFRVAAEDAFGRWVVQRWER